MKAVVRTEYGGPDVVHVGEVPEPNPGRGQVRLRVVAGGVDRGAWHFMHGHPLLVRPALGLRRPRRPVLGLEIAGVVDAVGPDVEALAVGDRVFGAAPAAFAEYAVGKAAQLARVPQNCSLVEAAALPVSGATALQALRDQAHIRSGQRVLVIGASGGVGSYAVQLAKAMGCEVVGVSSAAKADLVRSLGADEVIAYDTDPLPADGSFDVVLETGGRRPITTLRQALTPTGTLVLIGGEGGGRLTGGLGRELGAMARSLLRRGQRVRMFVATTRAADLAVLADHVAAGRVRPVLDEAYPIEHAATAFRRLDEGSVRGKVVIRIGDEGVSF